MTNQEAQSLQLCQNLERMGSIRQRGMALLQPRWFAETAEAHVKILLDIFDLPPGSAVLDVGCGVGECSRIMKEFRPDLRFILLNLVEAQLRECPEGFMKIHGDAHRIPLEGRTVDAVMFNAALGNMDVQRAFYEATRVLKVGGVMLINEIGEAEGDAEKFNGLVAYHAIPESTIERLAESANFSYEVHYPEVKREFLAEIWDAEVAYDSAIRGFTSPVWRLVKNPGVNLGFVNRFKKPALQFSGGKDSLALLYMFRPVLDKITVYNLDTGDACPETRAVIEECRKWIPNFVDIKSDVTTWRRVNGYPSDLVPAIGHEIATWYGMNSFKVSNRFDCCCQNLMLPMQNKAREDGVDMVIRGTKYDDTGRIPYEGESEAEFIWLPIRDWTHDDVFGYLEGVGAPRNPIYDHFRAISAPECLHCSAWWDDGKGEYLKRLHPEVHQEYVARLRLFRGALAGHIEDMCREMGESP